MQQLYTLWLDVDILFSPNNDPLSTNLFCKEIQKGSPLLPPAMSRASAVQPWIFLVHIRIGRSQLFCILFQIPNKKNKKTCSHFSSTLTGWWFQDWKRQLAQPGRKGLLRTWVPHSTELFVVLFGNPEQPQFLRWNPLKAAFWCQSWPWWHKHVRGRIVTEEADGRLIFNQRRVHRHFLFEHFY